MFEKEIKFIADFSLNKIKNLGSFFTFEKLLTTDIHPAILQYISAELDYLIYEDRRKLLQQSVFDYSGKDISKYFDLINKEIKKIKRISFEDIKKLVIQAVSFNVNYVSRPRWSLTKLVYDNTENKAVDEIMLMLNYLYYYDYLKNVLISYINKRKIVTLSLIEFELILNKIDKEVFVPEQAKTLLDDAFSSMGDLFNVGGVSKSKISPAAVEIFLKEKNLIDYLFRLRRALPPNAKSSYEIEEIRKVIYSTTPLDQQQILTPEDKISDEKTFQDYKSLQPKETVKPIVKNWIEPEEFKDLVPESEEIKDIAPEPEKFHDTIPETEEDISSYLEPKIDPGQPQIEEIDEVPEESELNDDELVIEGTQEIEDLLKMFDEELKEFEKETTDIATDKDEISFDLTQKDKLEEMYDFEETSPDTDNEYIEDLELDIAVNDELTTSEDYELSDEKFDETIAESFKKLDVPDMFIDEDTETGNSADKKKSFEFRDEKVGDKNKNGFVNVPEEKKKPATNNYTKDVFSYLSNKEIDKIISNVFNEDREDFTNTIERITECNSYEEATEILKGVFFSYRVNPYSRDAVTLTNVISNYFNQV